MSESQSVIDQLASFAALSLQTSRTMEQDKSQPPTPDGSGRPANFQVIAPSLYRSSYPSYAHFNHLADLELKTIITLVPEPIDYAYANFISTNGITHHQIPILANKDPEKFTCAETIHKVLNIMLEPSNYPLLLHCNKGKHRTGCMTACFRRVCGWTLDAAIDEYIRHSTPKDRPLDKKFIEKFDESVLKSLAFERGYIGGVYSQYLTRTSTAMSSGASCFSRTPRGSDASEEEYPNAEYQERARKERIAAMESTHLWSHR